MNTIATQTNLNDWVRGSGSTYKIDSNGGIYFIQRHYECGFEGFTQSIIGHTERGEAKTTISRSIGWWSTEAEARNAIDERYAKAMAR